MGKLYANSTKIFFCLMSFGRVALFYGYNRRIPKFKHLSSCIETYDGLAAETCLTIKNLVESVYRLPISFR